MNGLQIHYLHLRLYYRNQKEMRLQFQRMIILGFDIETTGLDKYKDRIIEMGLVLYSTTQHKILESTGFLLQPEDVRVSEEITGLTGITQAAVDKFGYEQNFGLDEFCRYADDAEAIIGHNIIRFDMPVTKNTASRLGHPLPDKLIIDTMTDIPNVDGEQLITMCAKQGFVNPHQHSAEDDAKATIKLASCYDFEAVIERAKSPTIVVRSHQGRDENDKVKKLKFRWNPNLKCWWKPIKQEDLPQLKEKASFEISVLDKAIADALMSE